MSYKYSQLLNIDNELKQFAKSHDIPIITPNYIPEYKPEENEITNGIITGPTGKGFKPGVLVCFNYSLKGILCSQCMTKNICKNKQYIKIK